MDNHYEGKSLLELVSDILSTMPDALFGEDDSGEVVISTGLVEDDEGFLHAV